MVLSIYPISEDITSPFSRNYKYLKRPCNVVTMKTTKNNRRSTLMNICGRRISEADALKSDIEKLRAPASKKEAWQILRRINRLASSDNELVLESIAKINVRDFVDPDRENVWRQRVPKYLLSAKVWVASNRATTPHTLGLLAKSSVTSGIDKMDPLIQSTIAVNPNTPLTTLDYLRNNSQYHDVLEIAEVMFTMKLEAIHKDLENNSKSSYKVMLRRKE